MAYSQVRGKAAAVIREIERQQRALWREREGDSGHVLLGPGQREISETVAKQKQLPSAGLDS